MEHTGGRSGSGRGGGRSQPRAIRGGRATSSAASVGRGGSRVTPSAPTVGRGLGGSPELPPLGQISSSPSAYLSSSPSLYMSSSPSTTDSFRDSGRGPGTSSDPQLEGEQHTGSPQSQVGEEGSSSSTPVWGRIDPATGKLWIRSAGDNEFYPYNLVANWISHQLFRNFNQPWGSWTEIPKANRDRWFEEFLREFRTLPEDRENLKKSYNYKGGRWLSERCYKLRRQTGKTDWIQPDTANELIQKWSQDPKFRNKSEKNKQNRSKMVGPSYVGGSIPISEHRRKIVESGQVPPGSVEWATFERTHSKQSEGGERLWISPKAQQIAETFQKLTQDISSQSGIDPLSSQSDNESLFFEAAGGFNNKGRVFGFGGSAGRLKQAKRSSPSIEGVSTDEIKKMKALVEEQAAQMRQQMTLEQEIMREQMIKEQEMMKQQMLQEQEMMKEQMREQMRQEMASQQRMMEEQMRQQMTQQQQEMMRNMQHQLRSLMKDKGKEPTPSGAEDEDGDDDADAAV